MTNGEKIKEIFPYMTKQMLAEKLNIFEWWNAEYKEPTTKNNLGVDCISREQALRELKESAEHHANDSREEVLLRRDRDIIRNLPSVMPQIPKTGHWIKLPLIEAGQTYSHECSLCGRRILATDVGLSEFPYCHCGAKMVEPQESEDKE